MRSVKKVFEDKRYTTGLLIVWMLAVCSIFYVLGAFHMNYMHIGPGEDTVFMGLKIDTWGKWMALAGFSFWNTCINEFISNALDPWFLNSLQDHKTKKIEYSHATCMWIVQIHCMYVHIMGVFSLFLFFSQVDFAIVRLVADWIVTGFSTAWFIQDKVYDPGASKRLARGDNDGAAAANHGGGAEMVRRVRDDDDEDEDASPRAAGHRNERDVEEGHAHRLKGLEEAAAEEEEEEETDAASSSRKKNIIQVLLQPSYERCDSKDPDMSLFSSSSCSSSRPKDKGSKQQQKATSPKKP